MNSLKEPKGIDFLIQSPPLTDKDRKEISDFTASRKPKKSTAKRTPKEKITVKK